MKTLRIFVLVIGSAIVAAGQGNPCSTLSPTPNHCSGLTWTAPAPNGFTITGYNLYRNAGCVTAGAPGWIRVASNIPASPTSYADTALLGNTSYSWYTTTLAAASTPSESTPSNVACGTTAPDVVNPAGNLAAQISNAVTINLSQFVQSVTAGTPHNDFTGSVGMQIAVGGSPITVRGLCRYVLSGNSQVHNVHIANVATGIDVASAQVATAGVPANSNACTLFYPPVALAANSGYFVVSDETSGGDTWYGQNTTVTSSSVATVVQPIYNSQGYTCPSGCVVNNTYGPPSLLY